MFLFSHLGDNLFHFLVLFLCVSATASVSVNSDQVTSKCIENEQDIPTSNMLKKLNYVIPSTGKHWVGDGFNVRPVFNNKAFTKDISPFLMFDYGPPKNFPPTHKKLGVGMRRILNNTHDRVSVLSMWMEFDRCLLGWGCLCFC